MICSQKKSLNLFKHIGALLYIWNLEVNHCTKVKYLRPSAHRGNVYSPKVSVRMPRVHFHPIYFAWSERECEESP